MTAPEDVARTEPDEPLLTPAELAAYLNIPHRTVYDWTKTGVGPSALRLGKHLRWRRSDVDEWIESNRQTEPPGGGG